MSWNMDGTNDGALEDIREWEKERDVISMLKSVLEMVEDNTKMPHKHTDPQLRLYCLAEMAKEVLDKIGR